MNRLQLIQNTVGRRRGGRGGRRERKRDKGRSGRCSLPVRRLPSDQRHAAQQVAGAPTQCTGLPAGPAPSNPALPPAPAPASTPCAPHATAPHATATLGRRFHRTIRQLGHNGTRQPPQLRGSALGEHGAAQPPARVDRLQHSQDLGCLHRCQALGCPPSALMHVPLRRLGHVSLWPAAAAPRPDLGWVEILLLFVGAGYCSCQDSLT